MSKFRLYGGLVRDGKWFNFAEVERVKGGGLAVMDGVDKSGAARFYNLIKGSMPSLFSGDGDEYQMNDNDYKDLFISDVWLIAKESMKKITNKEKFIIKESFYCKVCSSVGNERYTQVEECWDDLIEDGMIDEFFLEEEKFTYVTELPIGIVIEPTRSFQGGTFTRILRRPLTLGDMIKIQKNSFAQESEANMLFVSWDASIIEIEGMGQNEINRYIKRASQDSFSKKYIVEPDDHEAMIESDEEFKIGINADERPVTCSRCNEEIGGSLDFTNFFQSLLPVKSPQRSRME